VHANHRLTRIFWLLIPIVALLIVGCVPNLIPTFSHQGRLLDSSGDPVADGNYEVIYHLYNSAIEGSPVYTDTQTVVVEDGLFTTSIGAIDSIEPEIFSQPTWMEITVEGETLTPRERLQGAPYAFSLASGAVVQGSESIIRTFSGIDDTGATMTVWNTDASETGGNGLVAVNQASASGADRAKTAALMAIAAGGQNTTNPQTGAYGAIIRSEHWRGMYTKGSPNYFAAVFDSNAGIELIGGGSCSGCTIAYTGFNEGSEAIEAGDFVAVLGVEMDPDLNIPVMRVRKASSSSDAVVGVATSRMTRAPVGDFHGMTTGGFDSAIGAAEPGEYLSVAVQGLVQADVGAVSGLKIGDNLAMSAEGISSASTAQPAIGRAMSEVSKDGTVWVMLSGQ